MKIDKLERLRKQIDSVDDKVVDLLVKRYGLAYEIGKAKEEAGNPVKDADREKRVLKRVRARTTQPLTKSAVERIYNSILEESRGMQSRKAKVKTK